MSNTIESIEQGNELIAVVYKILNLINGKFYIGSSVNFIKRKKRHYEDLRYGNHHCKPLQRAFNKYGKESFEFIVLEEFTTVGKEDVLAREQHYLNTLKPQYNICTTAGSQLGATRDDNFKLKCSERMKGQPAWNKGKKLPAQSDYTKLKRAEKLKGRKRTPDQRLNISASRAGKPLSELHKSALSEAKLRGTANDKPIIGVYADGTIKEFRSICEASRQCEVSVRTIYDSLYNIPKKCKRINQKPTKWILKETTV